MDFYSQIVPVLRACTHLLEAQLMAECGGRLKHDLHKVICAYFHRSRAEYALFGLCNVNEVSSPFSALCSLLRIARSCKPGIIGMDECMKGPFPMN